MRRSDHLEISFSMVSVFLHKESCTILLPFISSLLVITTVTLSLSPAHAGQLERSLATFFQAPDGLVSRQVLTAYHSYVTNLRRRFFHLLLRHRRLERAFTLAEDINAKDLFMVYRTVSCILYNYIRIAVNFYECTSDKFYYLQDIHFVALGMGEAQLAELAKKKAVSVSSSDSFIGRLAL